MTRRLNSEEIKCLEARLLKLHLKKLSSADRHKYIDDVINRSNGEISRKKIYNWTSRYSRIPIQAKWLLEEVAGHQMFIWEAEFSQESVSVSYDKNCRFKYS